jgi:rubrerythrin
MALFNELFNTFRWKCIKCGIKYFYNKGIYKDAELEVHCPVCKSIEKEPYFDEYIQKILKE